LIGIGSGPRADIEIWEMGDPYYVATARGCARSLFDAARERAMGILSLTNSARRFYARRNPVSIEIQNDGKWKMDASGPGAWDPTGVSA
jgi:hypothetical protein